MKKLITIFTLVLLASCGGGKDWAKEEAKSSAKAGAASGRINASESNSENVFKELD